MGPTTELLGKLFGQNFQNESPKAARIAKRSVLSDRLKAAGAFFSEGHGWEQYDWFAPSPKQAEIDRLSWYRQNWFHWHAEEYRAAREDVVVMDMASM
ncbi:MAG: hypothetical protein AAFY25_11010 [Pseudomonadota bacterium]